MLFIFSFAVDDLSYNKTSSQSITMEGMYYEAKNAVYRHVTTCMRTQPMGLNSPYISVWWKMNHNICSISILFKNYDGHGIKFYTINKECFFFVQYELIAFMAIDVHFRLLLVFH